MSTPAARPPATKAAALKVLVAEDNELNQMLALAMLESLGQEASLAVNGREAVEACNAGSYDLVFMDIQMPEIDGYEATRRIRELHADGIYIIAMTANAMEGDREACLQAGMDDYISKPVSRASLQAALARFKQRRGAS